MDEMIRVILKILMWVLIIGFGCNYIMQAISYSFYRNARKMENISFIPEHIQFNDDLSGYGINLQNDSDNVILFFGGSKFIAYNSVGSLGGAFNQTFVSADYYGSQDSNGKMNLISMQQTATDLYDWVVTHYPNKKITIMGHSYGAGIATYLASVRPCKNLILFSAYRDLSDLYNKMTPIFWGITKIFISNNIRLIDYAKNVTCNTFIIGSDDDKTLSSALQYKVQKCFHKAEIRIFKNIAHENYLRTEEVIEYANGILN